MEKFKINKFQKQIETLCRKWKIVEFSLFGSVLTKDFKPSSDIDVLVTFSEGADWSLYDLAAIEDELKDLFGREVELVEKASLRNPFRRQAILSTKEVVYAAR